MRYGHVATGADDLRSPNPQCGDLRHALSAVQEPCGIPTAEPATRLTLLCQWGSAWVHSQKHGEEERSERAAPSRSKLWAGHHQCNSSRRYPGWAGGPGTRYVRGGWRQSLSVQLGHGVVRTDRLSPANTE